MELRCLSRERTPYQGFVFRLSNDGFADSGGGVTVLGLVPACPVLFLSKPYKGSSGQSGIE